MAVVRFSVRVALFFLGAVLYASPRVSAARERLYDQVKPYMLGGIVRSKYELPVTLNLIYDELKERVEKSHRLRSGEPFDDLFAEFAEKMQDTRNALPPPQWAAMATMIAQNFQRSGSDDRAMEFYRKAFDTDPTLIYARNRLATLLLRDGQAALAEEVFTDAVINGRTAQFDHISDSYVGLSVISMLANDTPEAIEMLRKALHHDHENQGAWQRLGQLYVSTNEANAAISCFENAILLNETDPTGYFNLAKAIVFRADSPDKAGTVVPTEKSSDAINGQQDAGSRANRPPNPPADYEDAERLYQEAIKLDREFGGAYMNLAHLLSREPTRLDEAIDVLVDGLDGGFSKDHRIHVSLATLLNKAKRLEEAAIHLESALKLEPRLLEARLTLTTYYERLEDYEKGIKNLDEALDYLDYVQDSYREVFVSNVARVRATLEAKAQKLKTGTSKAKGPFYG